jgi:hypothetical protein
MCRNIRPLRRPETSATTGEVEAAARQYVRKVAAIRVPSARTEPAFAAAVEEVAAATRRLLESLGVPVEEGPDRLALAAAARRAAVGPGQVPADVARPERG